MTEIIYQRIFEYTPDALIVTDLAGQITMVNAQAETLFGYDRSEMLHQPVEMLIPRRFVEHHGGHRTRFMAEAHSRPMGAAAELYALRRNGTELPVDILLSPMIVKGEHYVLCVVRDITERKAAEDKLRHQTEKLQKLQSQLEDLANRDGLTGLLNRRAFQDFAGQLLKTAHRRQEAAALLMIDLDHFKQVNDRFGHAEGDRVLRAVASALGSTARENDIVARYGGEEFVVAMLNVNEAESVAAAERLRESIAAITNLRSGITASIGVSLHTPGPSKRDVSDVLASMLGEADQALYAAKHNGRNQVCHFNHLPDPGGRHIRQSVEPLSD
jgi:diguanylate cyclase (GGDEF)-like protein/PAS domain S-box-containing protein